MVEREPEESFVPSFSWGCQRFPLGSKKESSEAKTCSFTLLGAWYSPGIQPLWALGILNTIWKLPEGVALTKEGGCRDVMS